MDRRGALATVAVDRDLAVAWSGGLGALGSIDRTGGLGGDRRRRHQAGAKHRNAQPYEGQPSDRTPSARDPDWGWR
jgi:hypothetical protein